MSKEHLALLYERSQLPEILAYQKQYPGTRIVCLDFWIERELRKKNISCISGRDFMPQSDEEAWWVLAQDIAREWYRLPSMSFFEHRGIRIGEALEPMMETYLSLLLYYARIFLALKEKHSQSEVFVPTPRIHTVATAGPLAFFERFAIVDAARMAGIHSAEEIKRPLPTAHTFPRMFWKSLLIGAYNTIIGLFPRRSVKIYASEYWSHVSSVIKSMDDAELVLMESSELKNIPLRQILMHRIRVRHPADAAGWAQKRAALERQKEFQERWRVAKKDVAQFLADSRGELDWEPVLAACEYLIAYSSRIVADTEALHRILEEEKPQLVLQRASIGGRLHHFFLLAREAKELSIPSVELQHAGAVFDPRSVHSRLETEYLAAYGEVEREEYARNGYAKERIIPIGSPRLDRYRENTNHLPETRKEMREKLNLDPARPMVMFAVPTEQLGLSVFSFSSYDIAACFEEFARLRHTFPNVQLLFKCRNKSGSDRYREYLDELFPAGSIVIAYGDSCPLIGASDCVITGNSTITYEAIVSGRPLILYPWKRWDYHLDLYGRVAPQAHSQEELADILGKLLSDESYALTLLEKQQRFALRHSFDGQGSERVAALLREIASKSARAR